MTDPDAAGPRTGRVRFRLLGPVQMLVDDQPIRLGHPRVHVVLAMLLLEPNTVVPTERIAEALWAGPPPETAPAIVYSYVQRLQEHLRTADPSRSVRIVREPPGYRIVVDPSSIEADVELGPPAWTANLVRLARRLAEFAGENADFRRAALEAIRRLNYPDPAPGYHAAPGIWALRDLLPPRPSNDETAELEITIYLSDEAGHERVETAVENLVELAGGVVESRDEAVIGSWFRRMRAKVGDDVVRDVAATAVHAAESRLVLAQDATVTATMLQNLGPVITSLQPTKDAVVRVGAVLIVKVNWVVTVLQLTAAQQLQLNHQPQLASLPHKILPALTLGFDDGEVKPEID